MALNRGEPAALPSDVAISSLCRSCGYSRIGLAEDAGCPECGFSGDWAVERAKAEAWYASRDGWSATGMPYAAVMLLDSAAMRRIALRRVVVGILVPITLALLVLSVLSSFGSVVSFERWRELDTRPGEHLDPDFVSSEFSALGDGGGTPYLPTVRSNGERYRLRVASLMLFFQPRLPARATILTLGLLVVFVGVGTLSLMSGARRLAKAEPRLFPTTGARVEALVILSWMAWAIIPALILELVSLGLWAAVGLRMLDESASFVCLSLFVGAKLLFIGLGCTLAWRVGACAPFDARNRALSAIGWVLFSGMWLILLFGVSFALAVTFDLGI